MPNRTTPLCRYIAAHADVTVVNIDYTPAPQSRFLGPVEQAYDDALWAASSDRPWDGSRLVVGGQSAGGALAAGASRLALEANGLSISLQVLMYPALDLTIPARQKKTAGKESFLVPMGPIFDTAYCPEVARRSDRLASPAAPADIASLEGIAPALIVTAHKDILREEAIRYAERLEHAGALTGHLDLPDYGHGFNILGAPRGVVAEVYDRIVECTQAALAQT
ncbi:alpha/beta hydrolase fold domain-containing protein [Nesterenkonia populi]